MRRDFLDAEKKHKDLSDWVDKWIKKIAKIYNINDKRCEFFDENLSLDKQSSSFKKHHEQLLEEMDRMVQEIDEFLRVRDKKTLIGLEKVKYKILESLKKHWKGLNVFVENPQVPMDNNTGERAIRNPVTGRKNFYGSGSVWSSEMAAIMFSIFETLNLWDINLRHWLRDYLKTCSENGAAPPKDLTPFLPWKMSKERLALLSKPLID